MSLCRECGQEIRFRIKDGVCIPIHASGNWCDGATERTRRVTCPKCRQLAYYVEHNGGFAWFDELGPPWPKHPCFDVERPTLVAQAAETRQIAQSPQHTNKVAPIDSPRRPKGLLTAPKPKVAHRRRRKKHHTTRPISVGAIMAPVEAVSTLVHANPPQIQSRPTVPITDSRTASVRLVTTTSAPLMAYPSYTREDCDCGDDPTCVMCEGSGWFIEHYDGDFTPGWKS